MNLTRCSHCGRTGTLTSLSAGNTCVLQDDCEQARQDAIERADFLRAGSEGT
jgi:hypothetical protein